MARSMEQVLAEVSKQSDPQRQLVLKQISDLPALQQAEEAGLAAQKDKGFEDIMLGARRRGVAYWGAPIAEQQDMLSTQYLPAVARMKQGYNDRRTSLESALSDIGQQDYQTAYNIFNQDRAFEEQQRQFNEQIAEQRRQAAQQSADLSKYFTNNNQNTSPAAFGTSGVPEMRQKANGGGYEFVNEYGNPISAAAFAASRNMPFRDLLQVMARNGDKGAQTALGFVGNDFGYDPNKVNSQALANLYNSLTWGVSRGASPYTPAAAPQRTAGPAAGLPMPGGIPSLIGRR